MTQEEMDAKKSREKEFKKEQKRRVKERKKTYKVKICLKNELNN